MHGRRRRGRGDGHPPVGVRHLSGKSLMTVVRDGRKMRFNILPRNATRSGLLFCVVPVVVFLLCWWYSVWQNVLSGRPPNGRGGTIEADCLIRASDARGEKVYSQNDEDGALLELLRCTGGHGTKEYFEFGSESGVEVNTRILRDMYGWRGHLLDGDHENATINLHKEWFTPSNIVSLLEKYGASKALDVLSVDCDYDDFYVLREILAGGYEPRVLVVEYNVNLGDELAVSTVAKPVGEEDVVVWNFDCYYGASASALAKLAEVFGYVPAWANRVNLMFVRLDQVERLGLTVPSLKRFAGPNPPPMHAPCDGRVWKRIDSDNVAKAADASLSHVDFARGFEDVTLEMTDREGHGRTFKVQD
ncbi:hypothetical protein ACHAWF_004797 [Thalassiosira exigua]